MSGDGGGAEAARPAEFRPPALLGHRHLQSLLTQAPWRRRRILAKAVQLTDAAHSRLVACGDGIRLQGYLSRPRARERGLVVLLHGWEGSADSSYVLSAGSALLTAGFSVFRLNFRDHGNTEKLNEGLFHSCRIDEVLNAVKRIREDYPARRFAVVGQSLGGNFALRIAARAEVSGLALDRVLAICPVLKPQSTMHALDHGFWIYRRYFLARWRRSLAAKADAFPHLYNFGDLKRFDTLTATTAFFVEHFTEFDGLDQYLEGYAVTGDALAPTVVPTRVILAADDPLIPIGDLDRVAKPRALEVTVARGGGHCGFVDQWAGPSWIDREIVADLGRMD
jgi:predicted alpha/beta-fold hydrolase